MSLSQFEYEKIKKLTTEYIEMHRPPLEIRDKVDLSFRIENQSVIIFEIRPNWNDPTEKHEEFIAKATYIQNKNIWKIYWQRADLKWHSYKPLPEVDTYTKSLKALEADKCGCFFG